jgi:hypothetical protein
MVDSNGNTLLTGTVGGPYFASLLTQKLGYTVTQGEPYYFNGCSQTDSQSGQCVFGNAQIPQSAWSVPAQRMLQYIPAPNNANGFATPFVTAADGTNYGQPFPYTFAPLNGGPLQLNGNPRTNGNNYFDTTAFSMNALGTPGNAKRRFFHGPGADNDDMALAKSLTLADSKTLLFRVEAFNVFNHTQFNGPGAIDGNIGSSTFGNAISAAPPRILQGAVKFNF